MGTMILITGGTGFIGRSLIRHLTGAGYQIRTLIRPSKTTPVLPKGLPYDIVIASMGDLRGIRAAMSGVSTVIHLVTGENKGSKTDLLKIDIDSSRIISRAAAETGVDRIFYLSHLGADRASAYPVLKTKGIAESFIKASGVDYTIFRTSLVYGPSDHFTEGLSRLIRFSPFFFLLPGEGSSLLQPIWIDDLIGCITGAIEDNTSRNKLFEIGGGEFLTIQEIVEMVSNKIKAKKKIIHLHPAYLRLLTVIMENAFPSFPVSTFWLDYLSTDRTTAVDVLSREFGILPARFSKKNDYIIQSMKNLSIMDLLKK